MAIKENPPLGRLFAVMARFYVGIITKDLKDLDISRYFYPLVLIAEAEGKMTQKDLAQELNCDKVVVVRIIDYLHEYGYVERQINPKDRREHQLKITGKARNIIKPIKDAICRTNQVCMKNFTAEEVKMFENLFAKMLCNLTHQPKDEVELSFEKIKSS